MADISKIKLPSGTEYNLKDASARADIQSISSQIEALTGGDAIVFAGISSAELTDGGTESAVIDGEPVTAEIGQLFFYGTQEFIYGSDNKWHSAKGFSVRVVQEMMGHSSLKYTERYTRVVDEQKKQAMAELSKLMEG